ncbi:hypothetical protein AXK56_15535 [Tsukamurella pulmonis]|uniref:Peptidyl-prolyl cis-trans isomerase n=1 Tax=Tsukamurella pulmonis TaxID=47312 RepID=A0A1H1G2N7_9ACTN|nr:hypothetical protein AXK56_15535 [Tsukamurella pulmonis]SDR07403.1 FKBP-type peptidyl-prolyl cis-trans isomerase [Tsukamurella pulmonis]SUP18003.1 FKBP-type peptidyl-prolyl cis-trans isomerase [Tsukamurella pulmonis]
MRGVHTPFARLSAVAAPACTLLLAACGSSPQAPPSTAAAPAIDVCPSATPATDARTIALAGVTGSAEVTPPTETSAPRVVVATPYRVDRSQTVTAHAGTGAAIVDNSVVTVCYQGVNGRTGFVFDDAFARATSAEMALPDVVPGFRAALVGQRVGARVVTSVTAADGYPKGEPRAGAAPGDTLIFAITVLAAN